MSAAAFFFARSSNSTSAFTLNTPRFNSSKATKFASSAGVQGHASSLISMLDRRSLILYISEDGASDDVYVGDAEDPEDVDDVDVGEDPEDVGDVDDSCKRDSF